MREEIRLNFGTCYFGSRQKAFCMAYSDLANESSNYCKAVLDAKSNIKETDFRMAYYLIGYALELYLKAYILIKNFEDSARNNLKRRIGHNLTGLYSMANNNGLDFLCDKERELILRLDEYYSDSGFRYFEEQKDDLSLPNPYDYVDLLEKLRIHFKKELQTTFPEG